MEHLAVIEEPRRGRVAHDLAEMLVIVSCAIFSEMKTFVDIAEWARHKATWLRRFLRLEDGLPSHDTFCFACPTRLSARARPSSGLLRTLRSRRAASLGR